VGGVSPPRQNQVAEPALHRCPDCGSALVQPIWWEQAEGTSWKVWRRCPECEWSGRGSHSAAEIDEFDEHLDLGSHELARELRELEHANMTAMAEAFVVALARDLIGADDFA
jgi:hypothetical protein